VSDDTPEARLARWTARDAEIGAAAERDELRLRLAAAEREIADLRARLARMADAVAQARLPGPNDHVVRRSPMIRIVRRVTTRTPPS
jgi:hypothetical protein